MESVSIVGPGRLGGALAIALSKAGYRIDALIFRSDGGLSKILEFIDPSPACIHFENLSGLSSRIVLITTADPEIKEAARQISAHIPVDSVVLHTSGALSSDELHVLRKRGIAVGSIHPLASVSDPILGARSFSGAYFCVEGDPIAVQTAESMIRNLGGASFTVEARFKPLYHAGAVMAAGHVVALIDAAIGVLSECGIEPDVAKRVLLPLIESSVANLKEQSASSALTGPFARADVAAIERHIKTFAEHGLKQAGNIYLEIGVKAIDLAAKNGADTALLEQIRELLVIAKQASK